ncbi:MAG: ParA family partition ATPase [Alphaproteobacteria bacterium]
MVAPIITVAQQKGGAGKTTLVSHLASALCQGGSQSVSLMDIDPQGSLALWGQLRERHAVEPPLPVNAVSGWKVENEAKAQARAHDLVIIDSAPHAQTETKAAIRLSSLVLIPVQPSPLDLWATEPTVKMARDARVPVMLVLNRVPPRARIVEALADQAAELGVTIATSRLGNRVAFAEAMMTGQTAIETHRRSAAADDIRALADEIRTVLDGKRAA